MTRRTAWKVGLSLLTLALVSASLVFVGRWEERTAIDEQLDGMERTLAEAGGRIDSPQLTGFRVGDLDCFFYEVGDEPLAMQLCFDEQGRLVEAADWLERGGPRYWSLANMPAEATVRVDRRRLDDFLRSLTG